MMMLKDAFIRLACQRYSNELPLEDNQKKFISHIRKCGFHYVIGGSGIEDLACQRLMGTILFLCHQGLVPSFSVTIYA